MFKSCVSNRINFTHKPTFETATQEHPTRIQCLSTMAVSPLIMSAIYLNETFLNKVSRYSRPVHWDLQNQHCFTSKLKNLLPWLLIHTLILPWVSIVNSTVVLYAYITNRYTDLNILQISFLFIETFLGLIVALNAYDYFTKASKWAAFMDSIMKFECHNSSPDHQSKHSTSRPKKWNSLYLNDGTLDMYGIALNVVLLGCFTFFILIPPMLFYFELDAPYHFFKVVVPPKWYSFPPVNVIIQLVRLFISTWSLYEGMNITRTSVFLFFLFLRVYTLNLRNLKKGKLSEQAISDYQALVILFSSGNESFSLIVPVYLGMIYWVMVILQTLTIFGFDKMEWHLYISIPYAGVIITYAMIMAWKMAIVLDEQSRNLKTFWVDSIRGNKKKPGKIIRKTVEALRPISISYGSLGTITTSTRASYFESLMGDTVQMMLTLREYKTI